MAEPAKDPELKVSCADSAFPRLSHEVALAVIEDLDIDAVDVFVLTGSTHTSCESVEADPAGTADAVGERLNRHGQRVADVFAIFGQTFEEFAPNHPDPEIRAESKRQFEAVLEFAQRLDAPGLTVLPGVPFKELGEDASLELAATELEWRAEKAGEVGMRLAIEPHFESIVPTPARTEQLLEQTERVAIALDVSHFTYQGIAQGESDPLLARTGHVHLRQARPGVMQARVGEGEIDFQLLRDRLLADGYDGYFALEYQWEEHWIDFTHVDNITETADLRDLILEGVGDLSQR